MAEAVVSVQLSEVKPAFDLPRRIGKIATLRSSRLATAGQAEAGCSLDLYEVPENQAIPRALSILSAIRLASQCSLRISRYVFPNGTRRCPIFR